MNKRRYWINTVGNPMILYSLVNYEPDETFLLMYDLEECNKFTYYLYNLTRINLKAKDKLKWVKAYLKQEIDKWL